MKTSYLIAALLGFFAVSWPTPARSQGAQQRAENVPIEFNGRVLDQDGQPVAGAQVSVVAATSHFDSNGGELRELSLKTDENGDFSVTGIIASSVDIKSIDKTGYVLSRRIRRGYVYGGLQTAPDFPKSSPAVFRVWKKHGNEALGGSAWQGKVNCDGTTNSFALFTGRPAADGDLIISCSRSPLNYELTNRTPYDYKFQISIVGGGIQQTDDEFTYLAPIFGYLPTITIEKKSGDAGWQAGVRQEFYVKTRDEHYGIISVSWDAGHRPSPTILSWDCSFNRSAGVHDLER